jgi:hypothetical protein
MKVAAHRAKAETIEQSLARCTTTDYETIIEACMLAGTHWFNIALHETRLLAIDNDAMHAEFLAAGQRRRIACVLPAALAALDMIESFRTPYVRGDISGGERAAQRALECLAELKRAAMHGRSLETRRDVGAGA